MYWWKYKLLFVLAGLILSGAMGMAEVTSKVGPATNLLRNPGLEETIENKPAGWSFIGSDADWAQKEKEAVWNRVRGLPEFIDGRGRGELTTEALSGKYALKIIPNEPGLSPQSRWYGDMPPEPYWISDPIPSEPGKIYLASGWFKLTIPRSALLWNGFIQLWFYDQSGTRISTSFCPGDKRALFNPDNYGDWNYWPTPDYTAPSNANTMRIVVLSEYNIGQGGFGSLLADNIALWEAKRIDVSPLKPMAQDFIYENYWKWIEAQKPPVLSNPNKGVKYKGLWLNVDSDQPGELFFDKDKPTELKIICRNTSDSSSMFALNYKVKSWLGKTIVQGSIEVPELKGWTKSEVTVAIPSQGIYGSYYVEIEARQDGLIVAQTDGRFAILPKSVHTKPVGKDNYWMLNDHILTSSDGALLGGNLFDDEMIKPNSRTKERTFLINQIGMGWTSVWFASAVRYNAQELDTFKKNFDIYYDYWHGECGLEVEGVLMPAEDLPLDKYKSGIKTLVEKFKNKIHVWMAIGVEQINEEHSYYRRMPLDEFDHQLKAAYEAVKEADPQAVVFTGAIATDLEGRNLKRLYTEPVQGRFDGVTVNVYSSPWKVCEANLRVLDEHGDKNKPIQIFEIGLASGPLFGPQRSSGERWGAVNLVRDSVKLFSIFYPRLERIAWFRFTADIADFNCMVAPNLQPRPQYAAWVVLADKLGKTKPFKKIETTKASCYVWKDQTSNNNVAIAWSPVGQQILTFEVDVPKITVTDLMGNSKTVNVNDGVVTVELSELPVYIEGFQKLELSKRVVLNLTYPKNLQYSLFQVKIDVTNKEDDSLKGVLELTVPEGWLKEMSTFRIQVNPGETQSFFFKLVPPRKEENLTAKRYDFDVQLRTDKGTVYRTAASLNFAIAKHVKNPPSINGLMEGWELSSSLSLKYLWQVRESESTDTWDGPEDLSAEIYPMWDKEYLYLMVKVIDDIFAPWKERSFFGFMGDSVEFSVQPDNQLIPNALFYEYEVFLSQHGSLKTDISPDFSFVPFKAPGSILAWRHLPSPSVEVRNWKTYIKPTGQKGNWFCQLAIPWNDLGVKKTYVGKVISFVIEVNDNDGTGFSGNRRWINWFEGLGLGKDPSKYGDLVLVE